MTLSHQLQRRAARLLPFVANICSTLRLDELQHRYFENVLSVIPASGLAFYLLDPETRLPIRTAVVGADAHFMKVYEERGRAVDPLHACVLKTLRPVHSGLLCSLEEWRRHPIYDVFGMAELDYVMEAPVIVGGRLVGTLGFSRRATDNPFDEEDLACAETISHFVSIALTNVNSHEALGEECTALMTALNLVDDPLCIANRAGQVRFVNAAMGRLLNRPLENRTLTDLVQAGLQSLRKGGGAVCQVSQGELTMRLHASQSRQEMVVGFLYRNSGSKDFSRLLGLLTCREIEVLELVDRGLRNKEIARALHVSPHTVKTHLETVFRKLGARSKAQLLARAYQALQAAPYASGVTRDYSNGKPGGRPGPTTVTSRAAGAAPGRSPAYLDW